MQAKHIVSVSALLAMGNPLTWPMAKPQHSVRACIHYGQPRIIKVLSRCAAIYQIYSFTFICGQRWSVAAVSALASSSFARNRRANAIRMSPMYGVTVRRLTIGRPPICTMVDFERFVVEGSLTKRSNFFYSRGDSCERRKSVAGVGECGKIELAK